MLFVQGFTLAQYPFLLALMLPIVVDLYCPFTIEHLECDDAAGRQLAASGERPGSRPRRGRDRRRDILGVQNAQLGSATSSSARARRSATSGSARCTAAAASTRGPTPRDPTLRRLIDVVPFGLPDRRSAAHRVAPAAAGR